MNSQPPDNSVQITSRQAWRSWLAAHHQQDDGVWLVTFKKGSSNYVSTDECIEEALCFGWIDSLPRKLDDRRTMLYFAPRKPKSGWSRMNKQRVVEMTAAGKMMPAGLAKIKAAKADGSWTRLDAIENLQIPDDLDTALKLFPNAATNFDAFPRSVKRGILEWIAGAKRPVTRAKRIGETARLAEKNERANQWPRRK